MLALSSDSKDTNPLIILSAAIDLMQSRIRVTTPSSCSIIRYIRSQQKS